MPTKLPIQWLFKCFSLASRACSKNEKRREERRWLTLCALFLLSENHFQQSSLDAYQICRANCKKIFPKWWLCNLKIIFRLCRTCSHWRSHFYVNWNENWLKDRRRTEIVVCFTETEYKHFLHFALKMTSNEGEKVLNAADYIQ